MIVTGQKNGQNKEDTELTYRVNTIWKNLEGALEETDEVTLKCTRTCKESEISKVFSRLIQDNSAFSVSSLCERDGMEDSVVMDQKSHIDHWNTGKREEKNTRLFKHLWPTDVFTRDLKVRPATMKLKEERNLHDPRFGRIVLDVISNAWETGEKNK